MVPLKTDLAEWKVDPVPCSPCACRQLLRIQRIYCPGGMKEESSEVRPRAKHIQGGITDIKDKMGSHGTLSVVVASCDLGCSGLELKMLGL